MSAPTGPPKIGKIRRKLWVFDSSQRRPFWTGNRWFAKAGLWEEGMATPIFGSALRSHGVVFFKLAQRWLPAWRFHPCCALLWNTLYQTRFRVDSIFSATA